MKLTAGFYTNKSQTSNWVPVFDIGIKNEVICSSVKHEVLLHLSFYTLILQEAVWRVCWLSRTYGLFQGTIRSSSSPSLLSPAPLLWLKALLSGEKSPAFSSGTTKRTETTSKLVMVPHSHLGGFTHNIHPHHIIHFCPFSMLCAWSVMHLMY